MTYNGWANYETWRVNLEICDDLIQATVDDGETFAQITDLIDRLKDTVDEIITEYGDRPDGIAVDYARAFVSDVDWQEIAKHALTDYPALIATTNDEEQPS